MISQIETQQTFINELKKANNIEDAKTNDTLSTNSSLRNITEQNIYFQNCRKEDLCMKKNFKSDEKEIRRLIARNFAPWKGVDCTTKVDIKDCSGKGGSRTYIISTEDNNIQSEYKKLIFHKRTMDRVDPLTEKRMCDAQKALWESDVGVPRYVSGKDWYLEPFVEGLVGWDVPKDLVDPLVYATVLAKAHKNTSTKWFEKHRKRAIEQFPVLKDAHPGSHIWLFTTRMSWYKEHEAHHKFWQNCGFEPLSEAGKRIVTVHGDIHKANVIVKEDEKAQFIDYEFTCPQWAVNDIAYMFADWNTVIENDAKSRFNFCKKYLEELGLPSDDEQVELLVFDAECQKLRVFHCSKLLQELDKAKKDRNYKFSSYKAYEKFEAKARTDKNLIKEIVEQGFFTVADKAIKMKQEIKKVEGESQKKTNESQKKTIESQKKLTSTSKLTIKEQQQKNIQSHIDRLKLTKKYIYIKL